jgi:hypothetical protein
MFWSLSFFKIKMKNAIIGINAASITQNNSDPGSENPEGLLDSLQKLLTQVIPCWHCLYS